MTAEQPPVSAPSLQEGIAQAIEAECGGCAVDGGCDFQHAAAIARTIAPAVSGDAGPTCERVCEYAIDVGMPEYSGVTNGKCRAHEGYIRHLNSPATITDEMVDDD